MTCHSVQGLSIDDEVTILDCNTPCVDRNFVWTAIARVQQLQNITYFEHSGVEIKRLEDSKLKQFLKLKIEGYKKQDIDAKRIINKQSFIDAEWLFDQVNKNDACALCNSRYYCVLDDKNDVKCNISVDRLNNDVGHEKDNCHLLCIESNKSKR